IMKSLYTLFAALLISNINLAQDSNFLIEGKAPKKLDGKKIYLDYVNKGYSVADSATITNGKFSFKGEVEEPNYARMILDKEGLGKMKTQYNGDRLYFYIGNEKYKFAVTDSIKTAAITGSALHKSFQDY